MKEDQTFFSAIVLPKGFAASVLLLVLLLAMAASNAPVVHAATWTVTSCADSGDGTLRQFIGFANGSASGGDTIEFSPSLPSPCVISLGSQLKIIKAMTINGPGESNLILDGQGAYRAIQLFCLSADCVVNISGLSIQNAHDDWYGAGIDVEVANLTLSHVTFKNTTTGGAMNCFGANSMATLNNVTFSNNTASVSGAAGLYGDTGCRLFLNSVTFDTNTNSTGPGGMSIYRAATLNNVTFTNNTTTGSDGGALYTSGTITVTDSVFTNNAATGTHSGGAILLGGSGLKGSIDNSTFTGNHAYFGAGIMIGTAGASLTVTDTTFANNVAASVGGGILNYGNVNFTNVTFSGNQVTDGGGYGGAMHNNGGQITLTNATFDNNSSSYGSAFVNGSSGTTMVVNSTIADNTIGPAIGGYTGITLKNTIVSNNAAGNCYLHGSDVVTDGGGNLNWAGGIYNCPGASADPKLDALANNGESVQTHALLAGSGAINAGNSATCDAAVGSPAFGAGGVDARGSPRRTGYCDIGAFEAQPDSLSLLAGSSPQSALVNTGFPHPLGVHVTDAYSNILRGAVITYAAPASGASAVLSAATANSDASGNASVTATANNLGGSYSVTASATGATPAAFNLTNTPWPTTTTVTSDLPDPSRIREAVTVVYTVTSPYGTPTGNVTVSDGAVNCTGTVATGSCALMFTTPGNKTLTAAYAGDGSFAASPSIGVTHTVSNWGTYLPLMIRP